MKLAGKAVAPFLGQPSQPYRAALFYGPDSGLVLERARQVTQRLIPDAGDPYARAELPAARLAADPALLADELAAISMLSPRRVIWVRDADDKLLPAVENAAASFNESAYLIVCAGELPARSTLRSWFEKDARCAAVACYHDEAQDVQAVVRSHLEAAGIAPERELMAFLSQRLGNDRGVTQQELAKLVTYAGEGKTLSVAEAAALVDYNRETSFDDAVNALADRNLQALDGALARLEREGESPVGHLRAMQRYFRRLYQLSSQVAAGKSPDEAIAAIRPPVFYKQLPLLQRHVRGWSAGQLSRALTLLVQAELACKTTGLPAGAASGRRLFQVTQLR